MDVQINLTTFKNRGNIVATPVILYSPFTAEKGKNVPNTEF